MKFRNYKIGMRVVKTAIAATLALGLASWFGLRFPFNAATIAILSVGNTKKSTIFTGVSRLISLALAVVSAFVAFQLFGFTAISFGIYLLIFIPLTNWTNTTDGVVVSSILVTHFLAEQRMDIPFVINEFLLMIIGVGFSMLVNLYMPNTAKVLKEHQIKVDEQFKEITSKLAKVLNYVKGEENLLTDCEKLAKYIEEGLVMTHNFSQNRLVYQNEFYAHYFTMRKVQVKILSDIIQHLVRLQIDTDHIQEIASIFENISFIYTTNRNLEMLYKQIERSYESYEQMPLPRTREELTNRLSLYQVLELTELLVEAKSEFSRGIIGESRRLH